MAVPSAPDQRSGVADSPDTTVPAPPRGRRVFAAVLAGVIVLCVLTLGFVYLDKTDSPGRSVTDRMTALVLGDDDLDQERSEVLALAQQFMLRVNTYGPGDLDESNQMPAYRDRVSSVITPKFKASFDEGVEAAEQSVAQAGVGRTAKIFGAGVSSIDVDSARVLVGGSFTVSYPSSDVDSEDRVEVEPSPFRVEVSLVKIDGKWLVDDFVPVTGVDPGQVPVVPGAGSTDPVPPAPSEGADPAPVEPTDPAPDPAPADEPAPTREGGRG